MHDITKKLLSLFVSTSVGLFVYKTIQIYRMRKKYRHIPGPPTKGIIGFYMGNLDQAVQIMKDGKILSDLINEWYSFNR